MARQNLTPKKKPKGPAEVRAAVTLAEEPGVTAPMNASKPSRFGKK